MCGCAGVWCVAYALEEVGLFAYVWGEVGCGVYVCEEVGYVVYVCVCGSRLFCICG